jgi:hypothetical protein
MIDECESLVIPKTPDQIKVTKEGLDSLLKHSQGIVRAIKKQITALQLECCHKRASTGWENGMQVIDCKDCGLNTYPQW